MRYGGVQLATDLDWRQIRYPVTVEQKFDGCRCLVVATDGTARAYSRRGTEWVAMAPAVAHLAQHQGWVFDCEIIVGGTWGRTNGAIHRRALSARDLAGVTLHVFDALTVAEYAAGGSRRPQSERRAAMLALLADAPAHIRPTDSVTCQNRAEVEAVYRDLVAAGAEGAMVKDPDAPYIVGARPEAWRRLKPRQTTDWTRWRKDVPEVVEGTAGGRVLRVRNDRLPSEGIVSLSFSPF